MLQLLAVFVVILIIGIIAFNLIAKRLQMTLLGYEPEEFANIYKQGEQTLRASTHEFLNKMHVVAGLIQMDRKEDALAFIGTISKDLDENQESIVRHIQNPTISALLLGKISRAQELNIRLVLRNDSHLRRHSPFLSSNDMITILGNFIENAFDAVINQESMRYVEVFISDDESGLTISVDDTGEGMTEKQIKLIKNKKTYTTKGKGHGTGIRLILNIIRRNEGYFDIVSELGEGSSFTVSFDKVRRGYHD